MNDTALLSFRVGHMKVLSGLFILLFFSCSDPSDQKKAHRIVEDAIRVHGGHHFTGTKVTFRFRDIEYEVVRDAASYRYVRSFIKDSVTIKDVLVNSQEFTRFINGLSVELAPEDSRKYSNSVNSVLYFFQLPLPLNDPAANKVYKGTARINGEPYHQIKVTFDMTSGGEDYEDVYYYWIHAKSHLLDYMAYSYTTDGGGVRFREAFNRYEIGGILFQDYINYKAPLGTSLSDLPKMYQQESLEELSRIVNENITVIKWP